jgi:hypothetical protein
MLVLPGFVVGFDAEKAGVADGILQCAEDAALPVGLFSLLYALPGTQLTRRLEKEGRLPPGIGFDGDRKQGDFTLAGLNFVTKRPRRDILVDFADILTRMYEPRGYFRRARRAVLPMRRVRLPWGVDLRDGWREFGRFVNMMTEITLHRPDMRGLVWRFIVECLMRNPRAIRNAMMMIVFFYFVSRLTRIWIAEVERQIEALDRSPGSLLDLPAPALVPAGSGNRRAAAVAASG